LAKQTIKQTIKKEEEEKEATFQQQKNS